MACLFEVVVNAGLPPNGPQAAVAALDEVERLEHLLSIYRPDSELSQLNRRAADSAVPVSPPLWELIRLGVELHHQTGGAFDLTAAMLTEAWGFHTRQGRLPSPEQIQDALLRTGSHHLELDPKERTVRFKQPGLKLNSGGIGKGLALDHAGQRLREADVRDFLVHGGQSSVLARGDCWDGTGQPGWCVRLRHPSQPQVLLGSLRLQDQALATSGAANQFFYHRGRRYGHIIDPRSGQPADGWLSLTVLVDQAARADALATGLYVMNPEQLASFCRKRLDVGVLAIRPGQRQGEAITESFNLPPGTWQPAGDHSR
jgi:thiamine biosynthesis lipoprotein